MRLRSFFASATALSLASAALLVGGAPLPATAASDPVVIRPGEVIVEVDDPSIDADDPAFIARVDEFRAEQKASREAKPATALPEQRAALTGGISLSYVRSTPNDVRAVVDSAVADWNAALATSASGPVHISFDWVNLNPTLPGTLGFAGPTGYVQRGDGYFYPVALANTLDNRDYTNDVEIEVTISSYYYNNGWYVNANDDNVPFSQLDLYATVLHEIGHGLGFLGSAFNGELQFPSDKYDSLVNFGSSKLLSQGNPNSRLTSNNLSIDIGGGRVHRVFAPSTFFNGSSFSHFDENEYTNGEPGSIMTPALANGEVERVLDAPTLGVLALSGWQMDVPPVTPEITSTSLGCGKVTVSWSVDLGQNGTPPTSYLVEALQNGSVKKSTSVGGNVGSASLSGLSNNGTYTIRVTPKGPQGSGTADTTSLTLLVTPAAPGLVNVVGTGFNRTVSWAAPNSCGSGISSYVVDSSKNGGAWISVGSTAGTSIASGALSNDVYQFRVRAINGNGSGDYGFSLPTGISKTVVRPLPLDGEIGRLYEAYFDRLPDAGGMVFYLGQRAGDRSLQSVSIDFAQSDEFVQKYGTLTNRQFVQQLYRNVQKREGDPGGVDFWTKQLNTGKMTRPQVVIGFSQSAEFVTATNTAAIQSSLEGGVYRLYLSYFLRAPDDGGGSYWNGQAANGMSMNSISNFFAGSTEFTSRYGTLSNDEFLTLIYANVLTRTPDSGGYSFWIGQLNAGMSRGDVMLAFSDAAEFIVRTGTTP